MEHPVATRRATADDDSEVRRLERAARLDASTQRGGVALVAETEPLAAPLGADPREVWVGTVGASVVGFATWRRLGDRARIEHLYSEPAARSVGVGDALLAAVERAARAAGCAALDASALPGDRETKNFFEAHGMVSRMILVSKTLGSDDGD